MRKTFLYILILGVLGFGVWYFLFRDNSLFGEQEAGFTVKDTSAIQKIFLAQQDGSSISLEKTPDGWMVNDKYKSSTRMIQTLLETLHAQFAAYPVPENAHNNVVKALTGSAVKVELFDKKGKEIKTFFVGGQATGKKGTYMLMKGATRPYVVQVPVYEGYLTPRYSVDLKEWRNRIIFDLKPEQIKSFKVEYPGADEYLNSFTLERNEDGSFKVDTHPDLKLTSPMNKRRVSVFTNYFQRIAVEGYLDGVTGLDSIIAHADKRGSITITDTDNNSEHIDIYWVPVNKRSKNLLTHDPNTPDEYDSDRFYGILSSSHDTVMLHREQFDVFLRKGYEFFQADGE